LEYLVAHDKTYRARLRLGELRDTLDRDGRLLEKRPVPPLDRAQVEGVLGRFRGRIEQTPPVYSSIKKDGVPLHRRVRRGELVEAPPRTVEIHRLELVALDPPDLAIELACSKGTYVRSLARDLGAALGTGGTLWELVRTRSGPFTLEQAISLAEVEGQGEATWAQILPPAQMVANLSAVVVDELGARTLASGRELPWAGAGAKGSVAVFDGAGELVAVAGSDRERLRPEKVFLPSP
jgi:tRNA pseudouridine55 synthase